MSTIRAVVATAGTILLLAACTAPADGTGDAAATGASTPTESGESAVTVGPCEDAFTADITWGTEPGVFHLTLVNSGPEPCEISGFLSDVEFLNNSHPMTTDANSPWQVDDDARAQSSFLVQPGTEVFVWAWTPRLVDPSSCEAPASATELTLKVPGASRALQIHTDVELCLDQSPLLKYGPIDSEPRSASDAAILRGH